MLAVHVSEKQENVSLGYNFYIILWHIVLKVGLGLDTKTSWLVLWKDHVLA